jgi:predicted RNA-binding Zn ribbon-like protein
MVGFAGEGFQPGGRAPAPPPLDLVQDFVNTEVPDFAQDDIATPEQLARWLRGRGLLGEDEAVRPEDFVAARALRALLRRLALLNNVGERPVAELGELLRAATAPFDIALTLDERGRLGARLAGHGAGAGLARILEVVLDAQASGSWQRMKACRKDGCGWIFYDASRNSSSTWCSMTICGNRTKTAAYRRRRSARS